MWISLTYLLYLIGALQTLGLPLDTPIHNSVDWLGENSEKKSQNLLIVHKRLSSGRKELVSSKLNGNCSNTKCNLDYKLFCDNNQSDAYVLRSLIFPFNSNAYHGQLLRFPFFLFLLFSLFAFKIHHSLNFTILCRIQFNQNKCAPRCAAQSKCKYCLN